MLVIGILLLLAIVQKPFSLKKVLSPFLRLLRHDTVLEHGDQLNELLALDLFGVEVVGF
jgi:hypothetical protein